MKCASNEFNLLYNKILIVAQKRGVDVSAELNRFLAFNNTCMGLVEKHADTVFIHERVDNQGQPVPVDFSEISESCVKGTKAINEYIAGLNKIYHETFKNDAELNIPFMHMISTLEHVKNSFAKTYREFNTVNEEKRYSSRQADKEFLNGLIDQSRDISENLSLYKQQKITYKSSKRHTKDLKINDAYGCFKAFGSILEGLDAHDRYSELSRKKKDEGLSTAEKSEMGKLDRMLNLADSFSKASAELLNRKDFSAEEIKCFFAEIPKQESDMGLMDSEFTTASFYQGLAFETFLGGSKQKLIESTEEFILDSAKKLQELEMLKTSANAEGKEKIDNQIAELTQKLHAQFVDKVDAFFMDSLSKDNNMMKKIETASIEAVAQDYPVNKNTNLLEAQEEIKDMAAESIYNKFIVSFAQPLLAKVGNEMGKKLSNEYSKDITNQIQSLYSDGYKLNSSMNYESVKNRKQMLREHMFGKALSPAAIKNGGREPEKVQDAPGPVIQ